MTYENIITSPDCKCLENTTSINTAEVFLRKLRKDNLADNDFHSHWDRGIGTDSTDCEQVCDYKRISINKSNEEIQKLIIEHYKTTFNINPKKGAYCIKFKFKDNAGQIKHSPLEGANSHYNLYKSDSFNISFIEPIEVIKFG